MKLIRGRWVEKYINCIEDKREYDYLKRGRSLSHYELATDYCVEHSVPDISEIEKTEIRNYWSQYGIIIKNFDWHRMYYAKTGIRDPKFIPDYVAGHIVYAYYNDHAYEYTWRDKNMYDRLLPELVFPRTIIKRIRNRFVIGNHYLSEKESQYPNMARMLLSELNGNKKLIIKPSRHSGFGRGVKRYTISTEKDILESLMEWDAEPNYIIQECIEQHETLAIFNASSTNMIRVYTWRHENTVDVVFAAARIGLPGAATDISFINGVEQARVIGINVKEGIFRNSIIDQKGNIVKRIEEGIIVPGWRKIIEIVKYNHLFIDNFDIVGWDFTVDQEGTPICFEANVQWPGTVLYQFVNGPLWGGYTDDILSFLKDKNNQYNYIPCFMR